ncbi:hypothetical protein A0H81_14081 [Grifola frondosa]|uniref:Uncharacterized protein n=1 Tax=Grifola frondosa TaxID=5627 RepID=A0A1C7LSZ9_GRIFR|nr:hypothetical protein A0H81_14081 [Grifola frondosa]
MRAVTPFRKLQCSDCVTGWPRADPAARCGRNTRPSLLPNAFRGGDEIALSQVIIQHRHRLAYQAARQSFRFSSSVVFLSGSLWR